MSLQLVVREVKLPLRCWPQASAASDEPSLVCPLCALNKHQDSERTALFSRSGYIVCQQCGLLSGIFLSDGTPVIPAKNSAVLIGYADVTAAVRQALAGSGHLLDFVVRDDLKPTEHVSFTFEPIVIEDENARGDFPPAVPQFSDKRFAQIAPALRNVPDSVMRILSGGRLAVGVR
jgi:hypothetical protein